MMQCEDLISTEIKEYELKLGELEKQMEEITDTSSTRALLLKLQGGFLTNGFASLCSSEIVTREMLFNVDAMEKVEEESECLKGKLLAEEMELSEFLQSYKAMRVLFRKRELLLGATKTFAS